MKKTKQKATIVQNRHGSRCFIERRIYADEFGREFVKVNGDWVDLDWYDNSRLYEVHRYEE